MKTPILMAALCVCLMQNTFSQCNVSFGSTAGTLSFSSYAGDIVHAVSGETSRTESFDIWKDDSTKVLHCSSAGGLPDLTFELETITTFDAYAGAVIDSFAGVRHDIVQSTAGLKGSLPLGVSGASQTSTGDVRGYRIKVRFEPHVRIKASNILVNYTSANTDGSAYESSVIEFLNDSGIRYAPAIYKGYYDSTSPARIDTTCPGGTTSGSAYVKRAKPWVWTGNGTFSAQSISTVNINNICGPIGGTHGNDDDKQVSPVSDAGLSANDIIGGFIFTVYAEDVACGPSDSGTSACETATNTMLTSTLTGFSIPSALPVSFINVSGQNLNNHQNLIKWSTAMELNNSHFEVENWQEDSQFVKVGSVIGAGNSNEINTYTYIDHLTENRSPFYRIKQVDYDGKYSYSEVVQVDKEMAIKHVEIWPNPAREVLQISSANRIESLTVFDDHGNEVIRITPSLEKVILCPLNGLSQGLYCLLLLDEFGVPVVSKFMKE